MMKITNRVGRGCVNSPEDVKAVHARLVEIGKIRSGVSKGTFDNQLSDGIISVQKHFMSHPDGMIDVNGSTHKVMSNWKVKPVSPGVSMSGRLKDAWDLVNPLLPDGSYCASAYRSADDQRRILHKYFNESLKTEIVAIYGKKKYEEVSADLLKHESEVVAMVRGAGQAIAPPGKSQHQLGKAIDVGGPSNIDHEQVRIIGMIARANPNLLSGYVIKERNGCVHFEIR
jgi:D-alanyl-D-alanine carboxypeptidase-like protein